MTIVHLLERNAKEYSGDTALVEIAENPHLHFEICKDGVSENPMDYISLVPVDASADYEG